MKNQKIVIIITLLLLYQISFAGSKTITPKATATITASCSIAINNLSFGTLNPSAGGDVMATGAIASKCSRGLAYTIGFNNGASAYGAYRGTLPTSNKWNYQGFARFMSNSDSSDYIFYQLYQDSAHTVIYGVGTTWTTTAIPLVSKTGTGEDDTTPIYGIMTQDQFAKPGAYTDTLVATLTF